MKTKEENKARHAAYMRKYRAANPERCYTPITNWVARNRARSNAIKAAWKKRNKAHGAAEAAKRRAQKLSATPIWVNEFFIDEIYDLARLRTEKTGIEWHVDHIVPLVNPLVCGLHVENNLRVITATENLMKNNKFEVA